MKFWNMNRVGPSSSTAISRMPASDRLMFDSHLMPRPRPVTTEAVARNVITTIRMISNVISADSTTPMAASPAPICWTPRPSEVATPAMVPKTARMSMTSPIQPCTRFSPSSGSRAHRMETGRPRRWMA